MPTVLVNGARLEYDITGADGPVVVQLHGLMSSRTRDAQLGLDLGRALRGHRVIRLDARGHGGSSGTRDPGDYAWDRLADDLLAALDAIVPGESVHGLGPSMGTGTLLHAVLREPARFDSLTLMLPPTAWGTRPAQAQSYLVGADLIEREGIAAFVELGSTTPVPPALAEAPQTGPAVDEALLPTVLRGAALADLPPRKRLVDVATPTLILAWTGDHTHPLRTATKLDETLPHSRLVVARTPYGVMAWPGLFAEHVITAGVETPATGAITLPTGRPNRPDRRSA
ncbi:alpha/beta fold hydrolase [Microbacterium aurantiacum]|uniref:alpha/beta fold hydrolase n=1 Tax=Microbacterium aurantiacum TaxID=162393 RepID=UPI001F4907DE|nr:alpha/beta fold hydrolase [Microbacterium aurantiacum]